jgi:hypothetical protein
MKKLIFGVLLLTSAIAVPVPTTAAVNVTIALPPPIVFAAPPLLIVLPETYVYVVPDVREDIFFYNGWWWRPWEGRWYRSRYYNSGWAYYQRVPSFYAGIPSSWRNDYRDHRWRGHQWNYQRIPHQEVQQNWSGWKKTGHWEKQNTWGVQGLQPRRRPPQPSPAIRPQSQTVKPQVREATKPQQSQPQFREVKPQRSQQQPREVTKPQHREAGPQPREGQPEHSQQHQGNHEGGKGEKQDRK